MKYYLTIFSIFKNEALYLDEWIKFHLANGVEHFYLYDDCSQDDPVSILQPYIDKKIVTYIRWTEGEDPNFIWHKNGANFMHRMHFITNYGHETFWCAFIDLDEFLFCPSEDYHLSDKIKEYEDYSAIGVNWHCYGNSFLELYDDRPVIERFTKRAEKNFYKNLHVKVIVKISDVNFCDNPHYFFYKNNKLAVNEEKNFFSGPLTDKVYGNIFRINHYLLKSKEEFLKYKLYKQKGRPEMENYYTHHNSFSNDIEDKILYRYLDKVKNVY